MGFQVLYAQLDEHVEDLVVPVFDESFSFLARFDPRFL